jgi:competence protein ComEA
MRSLRFLSAWLAASSFALASADKPKLPEGPGKETMVRICGGCHGAEIVLGKRLDRDGWSEIVANMIQRGAQGSDDEFSEIVDYLTNIVSKINVNQATAQQLQSGLGLSEKEATAILHYRDEKGDFKTVDDLKKVPGVDAAKIEAKRGLLAF